MAWMTDAPRSRARTPYSVLRTSCKCAHRRVVERDSVWHWLSVAQHYGLPTRLMDQSNIIERVLFPGLEGLTAWLKRHYSLKD